MESGREDEVKKRESDRGSRKKQVLVVTLFLLLICTPYFVWHFAGRYLDAGSSEKTLADMPVLSLDTISAYPSEMEDYVDDTLPFRNLMIRMSSELEYRLFHTVLSNQVILGKDGWLFYKSESDGDPVSCYHGTNLLTEEELEKIASNLTTTRDNLKKEGISFILFIAPNKERMYAEEMPAFYGKPAENYAALQIYYYLKAHTDIWVVYPIGELTEAKEALGDSALLWHKTDTHWNELGGYIGARALLSALGIDLPAVTDEGMTIRETKDTSGDLAKLLNVSDPGDPGMTYKVEGYDTHGMVNDKWDFSTELIYHASVEDGADPRRVFIRRDSFCSSMSDVLGSQFAYSCMVYNDNYYRDEMVDEQKPDLFIMETVERYAPTDLAQFVYKGNS